MIWIAFFSQTGSEIVELSKRLNRKPDLLVTNNFEEEIKFNPVIRDMGVTILSARHDGLVKYMMRQKLYDPDHTLVSLHGYLRILPADVCEKYKIYNGHPAAIDIYPELKGKNPQEKVWQSIEDYPIIGSVVHRCTAELDGGKIMYSINTQHRCCTRDEVFNTLRETSLETWTMFMETELL